MLDRKYRSGLTGEAIASRYLVPALIVIAGSALLLASCPKPSSEGRVLAWTWTAGTNTNSRNWISVASSSDGTRLAAVVRGGDLFTSSNYGASWDIRSGAGRGEWRCIASSSDGKRLAAGRRGGSIYTSTNYGASWTEHTGAGSPGSKNWVSIASSSDGTWLAAMAENNVNIPQVGGTMYTGIATVTNEVESWEWTEQTGGVLGSNRGWGCIASSSDGKKLAAGIFGGPFYIGTATETITNGEKSWRWNWIEQTDNALRGNRFWRSVAFSRNGTRLAAAATSLGGGIYTGTATVTNGVESWSWALQSAAGNRDWRSIASSSGGTRLAAVVNNGGIYTSSNSGASWTSQSAIGDAETNLIFGNKNWLSIASSSDGTRLAAATNINGTIYSGVLQ